MFGKRKREEEFVEIDASAFTQPSIINVRVETLRSISEASRIQQLVREGNVVFLRIKELRERDINELRRAVERFKKTCRAIEGDIIGVNEDLLILTPSNVRIHRG